METVKHEISTSEFFGSSTEPKRFRVEANKTRFGYIEFFVFDSQVWDDVMGCPAVIVQEQSKMVAIVKAMLLTDSDATEPIDIVDLSKMTLTEAMLAGFDRHQWRSARRDVEQAEENMLHSQPCSVQILHYTGWKGRSKGESTVFANLRRIESSMQYSPMNIYVSQVVEGIIWAYSTGRLNVSGYAKVDVSPYRLAKLVGKLADTKLTMSDVWYDLNS